jgi:putative protein-disulfide isomerase
MREITKVRALPIQGFPSLVLAVAGEYFPIRIDYKNEQVSYDMTLAILVNLVENEN